MRLLPLLAGLLLTAPTPRKPRLAVLQLQSLVGVTTELAQGVTAALVVAVRQRAVDYSVISTDEIKALLDAERQKQQLGCADTSCLAEIGGALGAATMVSGQLGKLGKTYLLTVKLVDVRHASVLREVPTEVSALDDAALLAAVRAAVTKLFPGSTAGEGDVAITAQDLRAPTAPSQADLQALLKAEAYAELLDRLGEVAPAKRDATWEGLVATAVTAQLKSRPKDSEPLAGAQAARALAARYPSLLKSPEFLRERARLAVDGFALCDEKLDSDAKCAEELEADVVGLPDLALEAADAVWIKRGPKWPALPLYALAILQPGAPACKSERLAASVVSALELEPKSPRVPDAVRIGTLCFAELKPALVHELGTANASFLANACPFLVGKNGLSSLQAAKCQR